MSKLTQVQKDQIVARFNNGEKNKTALAREFGTSSRTIGRLVEASKAATAAVEETKGFVAGDLLTGDASGKYLVTTIKGTFKVIDGPALHDSVEGDIVVEVVFHSTMPDEVGCKYRVDSEHFTKIGTISDDTVADAEAPAEKTLADYKVIPYDVDEYHTDLEGRKVIVSFTGLKVSSIPDVKEGDFAIGEVVTDCDDGNPGIKFEYNGKTYEKEYLDADPDLCEKDVPEFALIFEEAEQVEEVVEETTEEVTEGFEIGTEVVILRVVNERGFFYNSVFQDKEGQVGKVTQQVLHSAAGIAYQHVEFADHSSQCVALEDMEKFVEAPVEVPEPVVHFTMTEMAVALTVDGRVQVIDFTHPLFAEVRQLVCDGAYLEASEKMDIKKAIEHYSGGRLQIVKGVVEFDGRQINNALANKMVDLMSEGDEGFKGFAKFFELVMENPSNQTRARLMDFVAAEDIGLNVDGHIVAFKNVKGDFKPSRAGRWERGEGESWKYNKDEYYDNNVGAVCEMPRSEVDDIESNTCSTGLHVCSVSYLKAFWGTRGNTMKVTIHPADVVAIPPDYNNSKARVCKYTVVENVSNDLDKYLNKVI